MHDVKVPFIGENTFIDAHKASTSMQSCLPAIRLAERVTRTGGPQKYKKLKTKRI